MQEIPLMLKCSRGQRESEIQDASFRRDERMYPMVIYTYIIYRDVCNIARAMRASECERVRKSIRDFYHGNPLVQMAIRSPLVERGGGVYRKAPPLVECVCASLSLSLLASGLYRHNLSPRRRERDSSSTIYLLAAGKRTRHCQTRRD